MTISVVIPAAGSSTRMGKQFALANSVGQGANQNGSHSGSNGTGGHHGGNVAGGGPEHLIDKDV